jgi:hypothetical protein
LKRNIVISLISVIFLLHPTLTRSSLSIFQCIEIDKNDQRVLLDLDMDCYSSEHLMWCGILSVPILIVWVFGSPIIALLILIKHRKRLEEISIKKYFLILYQGLTLKGFYWEFVNSLRKTLILTSNVILSTYSPVYRIASAVVILFTGFRLQLFIHPYKLEDNNRIEIDAIIIGAVTLFSGLIFSSEDDKIDIFDFVIFIFIAYINIRFLLEIMLLLSMSMQEKI